MANSGAPGGGAGRRGVRAGRGTGPAPARTRNWCFFPRSLKARFLDLFFHVLDLKGYRRAVNSKKKHSIKIRVTVIADLLRHNVLCKLVAHNIYPVIYYFRIAKPPFTNQRLHNFCDIGSNCLKTSSWNGHLVKLAQLKLKQIFSKLENMIT